MDVSSVSGQSSIYQLVDQYMQLEKIPLNKLIDQKDGLDTKKSVFSDLDSVLSKLKTKLKYLSDSAVNPFFAKSSSTSDAEKVGITAQGSAVSGNHSVTISQLAKSDTRVSNQFDNANSDFTGFTTDQTFSIEVGHPTEDDPDNRVSIDVTVAASVFSGTNDDVMKAISDGINDAMSAAVANDLIGGDEVIHSSVVSEEAGKSRMVLRSDKSGYTYRMDFGSSALLDTLNINNNAQSSGTAGGYITTVGTGRTDSALSSSFTVDGLTFYRDSNVVDDAIDGITLKLLDTFSTEETVTIQANVEDVKSDTQEFIDKYNDAIKFLREKTKTDPNTHKRGALTNDSMYGSIVSDFRGIIGGNVTGTTSSDYTLLYDIGIEANQDGTISIKDSDKFKAALENNSLYVSDLFNSEDGVANKLIDYIDRFVAAGGSISNSKQQIDNQITSLNDRIDYMNEVLDKKQKRYFDQFAQLQQTMNSLQSQQSFFSAFFNK